MHLRLRRAGASVAAAGSAIFSRKPAPRFRHSLPSVCGHGADGNTTSRCTVGRSTSMVWLRGKSPVWRLSAPSASRDAQRPEYRAIGGFLPAIRRRGACILGELIPGHCGRAASVAPRFLGDRWPIRRSSCAAAGDASLRSSRSGRTLLVQRMRSAATPLLRE